MTRRDMAIYALLGFAVWAPGTIMFRFGGHLMFESGPVVLCLCGVGVAVSVCILLRSMMDWRGTPASQAVVVAVVMALPGLFGDVAYIAAFTEATGLKPTTAGPFAAVLIFGNASLLAYGLVRARGAAA